MLRFCPLFTALVSSLGLTTAYAQRPTPRLTAGRPVASFIPTHYHVLDEGRATGDLNRDGRPDLALVLAPLAEDTVARFGSESEGFPPRQLLVLLAVPGGGYRLAARARHAAYCKDCGGARGIDPFVGLSIQDGVLILNQDTGTDWHLLDTAQFRYQAGGFFLIGETLDKTYMAHEECPGLNDHPGDDYHDENFVTGEYEVRHISLTCKVVHRRGRHPPRPLRKLVDYGVEMP